MVKNRIALASILVMSFAKMFAPEVPSFLRSCPLPNNPVVRDVGTIWAVTSLVNKYQGKPLYSFGRHEIEKDGVKSGIQFCAQVGSLDVALNVPATDLLKQVVDTRVSVGVDALGKASVAVSTGQLLAATAVLTTAKYVVPAVQNYLASRQ